MIRLHPTPACSFQCPFCSQNLDVLGWYIPGMRVMADLLCPSCGRSYYGDLSIGQALYSPMLLEKETGQVTDPNQVAWFADWLEKGYKNRAFAEIGFKVHVSRPARPAARLILLNCLDALYGHCVLKLLNVQYYLDHYPDMDLIVLVPSFIKWMVPPGVSAIWEVDWALKSGYQWNDWLAKKIKDLASGYREIFISVAYSHPHPNDYDISRFVGIKPFSNSDWENSIDKPKVTYIWRKDRLWDQKSNFFSRLLKNNVRRQFELVSGLASQLKAEIPSLEFFVTGLGCGEKFPDWIVDWRTDQISEIQERKWCKLYAESHLVIGVHGSNMLVPSGLAGSVIDLMPDDRWGNILQDILFRDFELREASYRYRFIPTSTTPDTVAKIAKSLLLSHKNMELTMSRKSTQHRI